MPSSLAGPVRATTSDEDILLTELTRSLGDKRQVVSVDPVKWTAIVEAGARVGSARDDRKKRAFSMSALGHSRRLGHVGDMSGLPQTADISGPGRPFAFVPFAEV